MKHALCFIAIILTAMLSSSLGALMELLPQSDRPNFPLGLSGFTLVEFYSPKCRHCKTFKEVMTALAKYVEENEQNFRGLRIEQFNCRGTRQCKTLGITSLPTMRLYRNDQQIGELCGAAKLNKVIKWLDETFKKHSNDSTIESIHRNSDTEESFSHNHHGSEPESGSNQEELDEDTLHPTIAIAQPSFRADAQAASVSASRTLRSPRHSALAHKVTSKPLKKVSPSSPHHLVRRCKLPTQ